MTKNIKEHQQAKNVTLDKQGLKQLADLFQILLDWEIEEKQQEPKGTKR